MDAMTFYARIAKEAEQALFMTFAFGMNEHFKEAYRDGRAKLRYAMLEDLIPPGTKKAKRPAALRVMRDLRAMPENRFAVGNRIATNKFERWLRETLDGPQHACRVHPHQVLLVDPLGNAPIVITGSANFSEASTLENDETCS